MRNTLAKDFLASLVVFLVALPLCLGIAIASGMPPSAGLITGMLGGIVVGALAGSPLQVSGPAAGLAVFTYQMVQEHGIKILGLLIIFAGILQFIAGMARLGQVFRAISPAVIHGMLAGIGILIFCSQFHVMFDESPRSSGIQNLLAIPHSVSKALSGGSAQQAGLIAALTLIVLTLWGRFAPRQVRLIPSALVAIAVVTAIAAQWKFPIKNVEVPSSLAAAISWPQLSLLPSMLDFHMWMNAFAIAFVASAETLLCAAATDQMHSGPRTDYDKELRAQGVGNMLSGLLGGLPMTGVIVRSSSNVLAGAATRASAILHGVWLLALVVAFPQLPRLVPTASLGAILVYTGFKLVNPAHIRHLKDYGKAPLAIYLVTMIMIVATDMLTGIMVGLALSLIKLLYALTHWEIRVNQGTSGTEVHLVGAVTFLRLPQFADSLDRIAPASDIRVYTENIVYIDHASLDILKRWQEKRQAQGHQIAIAWGDLMTIYRSRALGEAGAEEELPATG